MMGLKGRQHRISSGLTRPTRDRLLTKDDELAFSPIREEGSRLNQMNFEESAHKVPPIVQQENNFL